MGDVTSLEKSVACIILAAGQGKRMKSALPKAMHSLAGRPVIGWILEQVAPLNVDRVIVVTSPDGKTLADAVQPHISVVQEQARGTADAVRAALPALAGFSGDVLILLGDMPLVSTETLRELVKARHQDMKTGLSVLGASFPEPPAYGRLILEEENTVSRIVEDRDCTAEERALKICNVGAFCVDGEKISGWVEAIDCQNAQNEYYITDLPAIAAKEGLKTRVHVTGSLDEVRGFNSRTDLAVLEHIVQQKLRRAAMENGATLLDPESVYFSWDTKIGQDVLIEPHVFFGTGVKIANHVHIKAFSHFEGAVIAQKCAVGPFARLRPGAVLGEKCKIGNFVEIKNSVLDAGVKAGHLAYIGDADIGADVNFSCGAITVNYDGFKKHRTVVGSGAMIGSNVNLIAPVEIGEGAYVAAGSSITKDVPADALAVAREKPVIHEGWAAIWRDKKK